MEQDIIVIKAEQKTTKTGKPFVSIKADVGKFSCFNPAIFGKFQTGQKYKVMTEMNNGFANILGINAELGSAPIIQTANNVQEARTIKATSMRESYAKDILLKMIDHAIANKSTIEVDTASEVAAKCALKIKKLIEADEMSELQQHQNNEE